MAVITTTPEAYAQITSYSSQTASWRNNSPSTRVQISRTNNATFVACAYRVDIYADQELIPGYPTILTDASLGLKFEAYYLGGSMDAQTVQCAIYKGLPFSSDNLIAAKQVILPAVDEGAGVVPYPLTQDFEFSGLNGEISMYVYFVVSQETAGAERFYISQAVASADYSAPPLSVSVSPAAVSTGGTVTLDFTNRVGEPLSVDFYSGSRKVNSESYTATSDSLTVTPQDTWFSGSATSMQVFARVKDNQGRSADSGTFTFNRILLSASASPSSLYTGQSITLKFTNRLRQTLNVDFYAGSTKLNSTSYRAGSDTFTTACPAEWVSGSGANITAKVSDVLGRTATSNAFTLQKLDGGTTTAVKPTGSLPGTQQIDFEWSYSGPGSQREALLEYSYDQNNWETLQQITSSQNTWSIGSYRFKLGRLYWRVTVTNSYGLTSQASGSVTITYDTLSAAATPQSVWANLDSIQLAFTNRLGRTVSVEWYSNNIRVSAPKTAASDTIYTTPDDAWFNAAGVAGNSMSVQARVSDDLGRTATSGNVTVKKPQGMTASPSSPRSTTMQGGNEIPFTWTASGDGTIQTSRLRWSTNNIDWTDLATVGSGGTVYRADPLSFPPGTIYWQVMVTNSFGVPGAWSSSASFTVKYDAVSQVVPVNSPTSGMISASADQTFQVALEASGPVYSPFQVQAATFFWRSNEMGSFSAVEMTPDGNSASVTIDAGTFESGTLEWYAEATDTTGRTTRTETYTLSALVANVEATPLSPINTVEAGNGPITFRWRYGSIDGSPQSKAELQYKATGGAWTDFGTAYGTDTSYTAPTDTFPGQSIQWRVRAYNADDITIDWEDAPVVSFVVLGATVVTAVEGDGKPFLTINWQTTDQLAFEVQLDGTVYGPFRSENARSVHLTEPLTDGLHSIAVRAQNRYSLWSQWREAQVSIINKPGTAVTVWGTEDPATGEPIKIPGAAAMSIAGPKANIILSQPRDLQTTDPDLAKISVTFTNSRYYGYEVQERKADSATWATVGFGFGDIDQSPVTVDYDISSPAESSGSLFRFVFDNDADDTVSRAAAYTYGDPYKIGPVIDGYFPPETGYYLIYRDGKLIGKTYSGGFVDRTAPAGEHVYYAIQVIKDGYYTKSNTITLTTEVNCPVIAPLAGGDFLLLELSESADRSQTVTKTGEVVYVQYSGATYPEAEVGEAESKTVTGDVSFTAAMEADARLFEAMLKKRVLYKTPGGEVVTGVLQGFSRRDPRFFKSYSFSVTQDEWRDYTDA